MNSNNETFSSIDFMYESYGEPAIINKLYVYMLLPLNITTLGIDLFSFFVLLRKPFLTSIFYNYIKVYFLNSIIICLFLITAFVSVTHGVFNFTNSYATLFYGCYIYGPLLSTFYLNGSLIEISMVVERCLYFLPPKYKKIKIISFNRFCLILLAFCAIVNLPMYFILLPSYEDVYLDEFISFRIYYWDSNTNFTKTALGKSLLLILYLIRDILPLLAKIMLNIMLVNLVRKYFKRLKMEKIAFAERISTSVLHLKKDANSRLNENSTYISKTDKNQTLIAIFMCIFSLFEHIFYALSYALYFMGNSYEYKIVYYLVLVSLTLKHASNFFIFYNFNYLFRVEVKKSLRF